MQSHEEHKHIHRTSPLRSPANSVALRTSNESNICTDKSLRTLRPLREIENNSCASFSFIVRTSLRAKNQASLADEAWPSSLQQAYSFGLFEKLPIVHRLRERHGLLPYSRHQHRASIRVYLANFMSDQAFVR